ncbi:hypothetical protein LTR78_003812 [Recurvomyces mirabilis]|uniref:Uncharacterized protein n=1 Tax=Recurvomyces mirabilis TaxID=574656 RepID=A0AAE0WR89_9PEZI|nr:hypothetical protein LTR78_003812 [Recurvomyces mirabilis]KAK5154924.1 hypothetical protein LTS14_006505 [Recurvomyces mirabilis]
MPLIMPPPGPRVNQRERATATCGILFLLQHHTDELQTRDGQHRALVKLINRHTFPRLKNEEIYNIVKLRIVGAELAAELSIDNTQFEDPFDMLCHQGIAAVPDHLLEYYEYDSNTFTEAELPPFDPSTTTETEIGSNRESGGNKRSYVQRATWIVLQDIDEVKHLSTDADYKYRSSKHVIGSLRHLTLQYELQECPAADGKSHKFDPIKLMRAVAQVTQRVLRETRIEGHIRVKKMSRRLNTVWSRGTARLGDKYLSQLRSSAQHRGSVDGKR